MAVSDFVTIWAVIASPLTALIGAGWGAYLAESKRTAEWGREDQQAESEQRRARQQEKKDAFAETIAALHNVVTTSDGANSFQLPTERSAIMAPAYERMSRALSRAYLVADAETLDAIATHTNAVTSWVQGQPNDRDIVGRTRAELVAEMRREIEELESQ